MSIKNAEENEKVVKMDQEVTTEEQEENKDVVEIQEVKKGPVTWFMGLKPWQKFVLIGTVGGISIYGGVKLRKVLGKNSKQVVEAIEEAQPVKVVVPMDSTNATDMAVQGLVNELAKAE